MCCNQHALRHRPSRLWENIPCFLSQLVGSPALLTFWPGPTLSLVLGEPVRTHRGALAQVRVHEWSGVRRESAALGGLCLPSKVLFCVPGLGQATEETLRWGVLRAGCLKKWPLCLQHTQQESGSL